MIGGEVGRDGDGAGVHQVVLRVVGGAERGVVGGEWAGDAECDSRGLFL